MPFIEINEVRLFYTDDGVGKRPVLFVHGYSCDSHDWSWQLPDFVADHRIIAVDLRGHGRSSIPDAGYEPRTFADDIAGLLRHLDCGPVVAIGHSLGGVIVSALAVEHPEVVRALVCVDPGYLVADEIAAMFTGVGAMADFDPLADEAGLAAMYGPASPAALRTWHARRIAGMPAVVLQKTLSGLFEGPQPLGCASVSDPYLRERRCPVFAIYAEPDRAALEIALLAADKRSKVVTWEGAGHWLHQERPVEFNALVLEWLATLPS